MFKSKFDIPSPAVTVDLDIAQKNIDRVSELAKIQGLNLRPHVKAHKTVYFAKKQMEAGAYGITVAKLSEAEVMAQNGIDNILIAFPLIGKEKWDRYSKLNKTSNIITTIDSIEGAKGLNDAAGDKPVKVLIEVDFGTLRCGVQPGNDFAEFARKVKELNNLILMGAFTYNGLIYNSNDLDEIRNSACRESNLLAECGKILLKSGIKPEILSGGNTPDTLAFDKMREITEVRPGNYIFNDVSGLNLNTASIDQCSLRVCASVVSITKPGHAAIDAGSKTLTTDKANKSLDKVKEITGHGFVIEMPDAQIIKVNEEHGYLKYDPEKYNVFIGQRINIIPNHACVVPNLFDHIYGIRNDEVETIIKVEARGKNY